MLAYLTAFGFATGLALDTAAVAGARAVGGGRSVLLPWLFGAAHAVMATLGWAIGRGAAAVLERWDHWVAFALLVVIAARMLVSSWRPHAQSAPPARGWELALLTIATSVDALAAGLAIDSLGIAPVITIGLVAAVCVALTTIAGAMGQWLGARGGRWLERAGGLVLVAVAIHVVAVHTR